MGAAARPPGARTENELLIGERQHPDDRTRPSGQRESRPYFTDARIGLGWGQAGVTFAPHGLDRRAPQRYDQPTSVNVGTGAPIKLPAGAE